MNGGRQAIMKSNSSRVYRVIMIGGRYMKQNDDRAWVSTTLKGAKQFDRSIDARTAVKAILAQADERAETVGKVYIVSRRVIDEELETEPYAE
jgi:hypothetical protein